MAGYGGVAGAPEAAVPFEQLAPDMERILGTDGTSAVLARGNLAYGDAISGTGWVFEVPACP